MSKKKNKERWNHNVEGNARIIAERVKQAGIIITGINKDVPNGMEEALENCLLNKYNIEILRFEEWAEIRVITQKICDNKQRVLIRNMIKANIPEIKKQHEISKNIWEQVGGIKIQ